MRRMSGQRNFAWIEGGVECRWNAAADLSGSTGQRPPCGNRTDSCSSGNGKRFSGIRRSTSDSHRRRNSSPSLCSLKSCFSSSSLYFLLLFSASRAFKGADAHPLETLQSGVSSGARQPPLNAQRRSKIQDKGNNAMFNPEKNDHAGDLLVSDQANPSSGWWRRFSRPPRRRRRDPRWCP